MFDFNAALKNGGTIEGIAKYLTEKGRGQEALDYFRNSMPSVVPEITALQERMKSAKSVTGLTPENAPQIIREAPPLIGFVAGEVSGGPPGAAAGSAIGETISQVGEKLFGQREKFDVPKIVEAGAVGALTPPLFKGGIEVIGNVLKIGGKVSGKVIGPFADIAKAGWKGIKKILPGISDESSMTIAKFPREVEVLAKAKTLPINYIVDDVIKARNVFEKNLSSNYQKQWEKLLSQGEKFSYKREDVVRSINNFLEKEIDKGNIFFKRLPNGKLDFGGSPFTKNQQKVVTEIINEIERAKPQGIAEIRALKQRINGIYQEYAAQFEKSSQLNRFVTNMVNAVDDALPPKLREISKAYSEGLGFLGKVDELLLPTSGATGLPKATTITRIKSMTKDEIRSLYGDFLNEFKKKTGYDLEKSLDIYNAAREINPNLIPQDTGGITRGIQRAANPLIGMTKIKYQEALQSPIGKAFASAFPDIFNAMKIVLEKGLQAGTFEATKQGADILTQQLRK